jgi:hypothetical protein
MESWWLLQQVMKVFLHALSLPRARKRQSQLQHLIHLTVAHTSQTMDRVLMFLHLVYLSFPHLMGVEVEGLMEHRWHRHMLPELPQLFGL